MCSVKPLTSLLIQLNEKGLVGFQAHKIQKEFTSGLCCLSVTKEKHSIKKTIWRGNNKLIFLLTLIYFV